MYMDEEMEEEEELLVVDLDYEFDADCFFDFTRLESSSKAEVSENWFRCAATYPPSPFIVNHKSREETYRENSKASLNSNPSNTGETLTSNSKISDYDISNREGPKIKFEMVQNIPKLKAKTMVNSSAIRSSSFMRPTASHLAKLKPASEIYSSRSVGRSPRSLNGFSGTSPLSPISAYQDATKRQKLDIGYLLKKSLSMNHARLKHPSLWLYKLSKVPSDVGRTEISRPKPTIPRGPDLETANRAQRQRSRNNLETDVNAKLKSSSSKEQPVNKKVLMTSPLSPEIRNERQPPAFQRPDDQNSESKSTNGIKDIEKLNYDDTPKQEKCEPAKGAKKLKHPADYKSSCNPPTELFKELSLKSEVESDVASRSKQLPNKKVPKENLHGSFRREMSVS